MEPLGIGAAKPPVSPIRESEVKSKNNEKLIQNHSRSAAWFNGKQRISKILKIYLNLNYYFVIIDSS